MKPYEFVRPLTFRLSSSVQTLSHRCFVLQLHSQMKLHLRQTLARANKRPLDQVRLPIASLNKAMRMLIPGITSITPGADLEQTEIWLYGHEEQPASPQALRLILDAWIMTAFTALSQQEREQLADEVAAFPLDWQERELDLAQWKQNNQGTALFARRQKDLDGFVLLPDLIAARLTETEPEMIFHWGENPLRFRRVPAYGKAIELISWPPLLYHEKEQRQWPYSVMLTLSAQTIPFLPYPILNCEVGIRRWAGPSVSSFPPKEDTSIYLADRVPWITSVHRSRSFQVAPASWERIPEHEREGDATHRLVWNSTLIPLLNALHVTEQDKIPSPEDLRKEPMAYMSFQGLPSAAIVFRNGIQPAHEVGTGLMPVDRYHFMEQLKEKVAPTLEPVTPYQRREVKFWVPNNPFFSSGKTAKKEEKPSETELQQQRRRLVAQQCGGILYIEIWYQAQRMRQTLIQAMQRLLGGDFPAEPMENFSVITEELRLVIYTQSLGELGAVLSIPTEKKEKRQERIRQAIRQRVQTIEKTLPERSGRVLAFVELDDEDLFPGGRDPKPALRKGFAFRERLTQFITPHKEEKQWSEKRKEVELEALEHRAESAVLDLLRQLGVLGISLELTVTPEESKLHLPTKLHYLGVWLIKQYQASSATHIAQLVPVFVHMEPLSQEILVLAPGFEDWLPYADAQLALAQDRYVGFQRKEDALQFLLSTLHRCLPVFQDTLLLCHAQNLRGTWEWLTEEKITRSLPPSLEQYSRTRIIRVRTGPLETAQWYAESENVPYAFTQGVFQMGKSGQVFASIQGKPATATKSKSASKVLPRQGFDKHKQPKTFEPDPTLSAWNPSMGEMTFVGADANEALLYVSAANQLRHGFMVQFEYGLILPFPLHLAQRLEAYVIPTNALIQQMGGNEEENTSME